MPVSVRPANWGGRVSETNFWIGFRTHSGVIHKSQFCWKAASGIQLKQGLMAETDEMVGASFLSICVTVGAASFGPPKTRNLLSSALPFNVVAPLFFRWVWRQLAAYPTSEPTPKPQTTWHSSETHPEPTSNPPHCTLHGRARGTHTEPTGNPTGNPAGTCMAEREEPRGAYESPPGTHRKPTPNRV